eukprot:6365702-Amphidinium_carterae.1
MMEASMSAWAAMMARQAPRLASLPAGVALAFRTFFEEPSYSIGVPSLLDRPCCKLQQHKH